MTSFVPPDLAAAVANLRAGVPESPEDALTRFTIELEFVQCLANPQYLGCTFVHYELIISTESLVCMGNSDLASCKTLEDPSFVAYLEYLLYWKRPEYAARLL